MAHLCDVLFFSYIKMSSPNMNNMIMIGCLLTYLSVILLGTDGGLVRQQNYPAMCSVSTQTPHLPQPIKINEDI